MLIMYLRFIWIPSELICVDSYHEHSEYHIIPIIASIFYHAKVYKYYIWVYIMFKNCGSTVKLFVDEYQYGIKQTKISVVLSFAGENSAFNLYNFSVKLIKPYKNHCSLIHFCIINVFSKMTTQYNLPSTWEPYYRYSMWMQHPLWKT